MLKKLSITACIILAFFWMFSVNSLISNTKFGKPFELYLHTNSSDATIVCAENLSLKDLVNVRGASFTLDSKVDVQALLSKLNAKTVKTEVTPFGKSVYAYSKDIKYKKLINGTLINVHIFISQNSAILGVPLIYGSY